MADCCSHPVLWSYERRKIEERKRADECLSTVRQEKENKIANKFREREEYKKMMQLHNPWGKPGGGAPNMDIRMKNIYLEGLYPEPKENPRTPLTPTASKYKYRGSETGGGGAPLRDSSGKVITPIKEDPMLSFNDANRDHVDSVLRYKTNQLEQSQYKHELDRLTAEQALKRIEERQQLREFAPKTPILSEYTEMNRQQPWGKAGPGGVPWRNPKAKGQDFMKSLGWTNKKVLKEIDKQIIHKSKQSNSSPIKPLNLESTDKNENLTPCCSRCICECPSRYNKAKTDDFVMTKQAYPKPIQTAAPRKSSPIYYGPKKKSRQHENAPCYTVSGGVELVPLLAKRRSANKPVSLSTTDVTRVRDIHTSWREPIGADYLEELNEQIHHRQKEIEVYRQRDAEISQRHYETWQGYWGRPGAGAPTQIKKKLNLTTLLYPRRHCRDCNVETNIDGY